CRLVIIQCLVAIGFCRCRTLRLRRGCKRERGTSGRWQPSPAAGCSAPTSTLPVNTLCGHRLPLLHIEAIVVDRPSTRGWAWVLDDQDLSPSLGMELLFIVRIGMEDHGARPVLVAADPKCALEDIPDLREIVVVQRMMRPRLKAQNARVRLGRPLGTRMEEHLARLSGPANHFPCQLVAMTRFHRLMFREFWIGSHGDLLLVRDTPLDRTTPGSGVPLPPAMGRRSALRIPRVLVSTSATRHDWMGVSDGSQSCQVL